MPACFSCAQLMYADLFRIQKCERKVARLKEELQSARLQQTKAEVALLETVIAAVCINLSSGTTGDSLHLHPCISKKSWKLFGVTLKLRYVQFTQYYSVFIVLYFITYRFKKLTRSFAIVWMTSCKRTHSCVTTLSTRLKSSQATKQPLSGANHKCWGTLGLG